LHIGSADIFHVQQFGLDEDNYIGNNPQENGWIASWPEFFVERRLKPQIQLGVRNGLIDQNFQYDLLKLCDVIFHQLSSEHHIPALLHGDLWSGNVLFNTQNQPVLIDPAVYFGVAEAELAFTELFGGFTRDFYDAYQAILPIPYGYQEQKHFYNLYHMLNHLNLFGGMFHGQIQTLCHGYISKNH
jgi:protein-ribulosamine 3-kinase